MTRPLGLCKLIAVGPTREVPLTRWYHPDIEPLSNDEVNDAESKFVCHNRIEPCQVFRLYENGFRMEVILDIQLD